jgi:AraC family transcriptional regulator of arabinose operon
MSHPQPRFAVSERSYTAAPNRDRHPFYQAVLPQRGRLEMEIADERGFAGETSFALVPSEVEHTYWASGPNRFFILDLAPTLIAEAQASLGDSTWRLPGAFPAIDERLVALGALLRTELARGGFADSLIADSLGLYVGSVLLAPDRPPGHSSTSSSGARRLALKARDFLDASYDRPLLLREIADAVGASVSHVQRCFRAQHGTTIVGYVQARRLARARELLLASDLAIGEVAFASGFNEQSYFTRIFTRETGLSPSRYRAAMRARSDKYSR